ncbi:Scr1 family TA system antitoxin-like transcriptional regulator [Kitasatospora sp. NPDC059827]|uniref:helix-turn-helix domain-containing protein n=1 Tax=Kitasatospora sp. NPDC059827 TaxID=3346964 RepID=UPI003652927E
MGTVRKSESGEDIRTELPEDLTEVSDFLCAIGKQIKILRERAGLTQKQLAERVGYTEQLIRSVERGVRTPQPELLIALDKELNAGGLLAIARNYVMSAKAKARVRHPAWFRDYVSLEDVSIESHFFATLGIPGLLQTEAHARAVYAMRQPPLSEEVIEMRVAARLARQEVLTRWPRGMFSWVICESVLRRPLGGWDVHAAQLRHLLHAGRMRGVVIQVLPLDRTEHAGMGGPFILITPKGRPQHGYIEVQTSSRLISDPDEVQIMNARYNILRAQAHGPEETLALIEKILGER